MNARQKLMDFLAMRDHSEKELRTKLARGFESPEIDVAIAEAKERGYLLAPEELAKRTTRTLNRKEKSHQYIRGFLKKLGLPETQRESTTELEKARVLVSRKFRKDKDFDFEERKKVYRYLTNRGFDYETIRRVTNSQELDEG